MAVTSYTDNRLVSQYSDSERLKALFYSVVDQLAIAAAGSFVPLLDRLNIDKMAGLQLDYIGSIVGLPRPPSFTAEVAYLNTVYTYSAGGSPGAGTTESLLLENGTDSLLLEDGSSLFLLESSGSGAGASLDVDPNRGYGQVGNPGLGGVYIEDQTFVRMSDADYRRFLRAKILKNNSVGSVWDLQQFGVLIFDTPLVVNDTVAGKVTLTLPYPLEPQALATVVNTLPLAQGVELAIIYA